MALIPCPECHMDISNKALFCPSCGFPMTDRPIPIKAKKTTRKKRPNGSGSVVKRSGHYSKPYEVRINTHIDERGYPAYDVLGTFADRVEAEIALAEYNKSPYDPSSRNKTFEQLFNDWYLWKFKIAADDKKAKTNSQGCYIAAFKKCAMLHDKKFSDLRAPDMQTILDRVDLSYATLEHIKTLLNQMSKYCLQYDIIEKDYSKFIKITKDDDDEHGMPFTRDEVALLWTHKDIPFVDTILIYIYSGWRLNELAEMPLSDIDLDNRTYFGGLKTRISRERTVPIHSKIYEMVERRYRAGFKSLMYHNFTKKISEKEYRIAFNQALLACGITTEHTPHDCRHTCNTLLDDAGANRVSRYRIMGHAGKDINEKVYTHKDIEELRKALEMI